MPPTFGWAVRSSSVFRKMPFNKQKLACTLACTLFVIFAISNLTGCRRLHVNGVGDQLVPSNDRDWKPEFATLPIAEIDERQYTLRNIRNCNYVTADDYVVNYYDRQIVLDQIQSVDFIVVPFKETPKLAHTMISFGLDDGSYLAVSVEVRKERGEEFNALMGVGRQYELIYVLSDERDVIRLRSRHRDSDVYVYPTVANQQQAQAMFAEVMGRINELSVNPEFYHSITNNCTTNLAGHVNELSPGKIAHGWQIILPGLSAKYAYDRGLLDNRIPFEDLSSVALVNHLAEKHFEDPDFSKQIRSNRDKLDRYLARQQDRERRISDRGRELLDTQQPQRRLLRR